MANTFNTAYNPDAENRIAVVWQKVQLLQEVRYIKAESEKYEVAYRLMEIELNKVCSALKP